MPRIEVSPCPAGVTNSADVCQPGYHLEHSDTNKCVCIKDMFELPCPNKLAKVEGTCDAGFSFVRSIKNAVEVCECQRTFWEVACPSQLGDCASVCPRPYELRRVATANGPHCGCSDPAVHDEVLNPFWKNGCEYCAYGNGECAYNYRKGWFCRCMDKWYTGPDCLME